MKSQSPQNAEGFLEVSQKGSLEIQVGIVFFGKKNFCLVKEMAQNCTGKLPISAIFRTPI